MRLSRQLLAALGALQQLTRAYRYAPRTSILPIPSALSASFTGSDAYPRISLLCGCALLPWMGIDSFDELSIVLSVASLH